MSEQAQGASLLGDAQRFVGDRTKIVGVRRESSTFVDSDGNSVARDSAAAVEKAGIVLVSNGLWHGRGETLAAACSDLIAHLDKHGDVS